MACPCHASVQGCTHPPPATTPECSHILAHSDPCWCCRVPAWHSHARSGWNHRGNRSCSTVPAAPTPPIPTILDRSSDPLCSDTPRYSALPPDEPTTHALASAASVHPEPPPPK